MSVTFTKTNLVQFFKNLEALHASVKSVDQTERFSTLYKSDDEFKKYIRCSTSDAISVLLQTYNFDKLYKEMVPIDKINFITTIAALGYNLAGAYKKYNTPSITE